MSMIERAMKHYEGLGTQSMTVPEWSSIVYWAPLTLMEKAELLKPGVPVRETIWADVVIRKAIGVDGKPLFNLADREHLMRAVDANVITRVGRAIMGAAMGAGDEAVELAEKN